MLNSNMQSCRCKNFVVVQVVKSDLIERRSWSPDPPPGYVRGVKGAKIVLPRVVTLAGYWHGTKLRKRESVKPYIASTWWYDSDRILCCFRHPFHDWWTWPWRSQKVKQAMLHALSLHLFCLDEFFVVYDLDSSDHLPAFQNLSVF